MIRINFKKTKRVALLCAGVAALSFQGAALAQDDERETSFTVVLNQDAFFGFYPSFNGLIEVSDNVDFSFYGIQWTRPSFGLGGNSGDDLWTEFGAGVNLSYMDDKLNIKPQVGVTAGALLSGGDLDSAGNVTGANFLDGIVPSLTVNYSGDKWEAEWYSGMYLAATNRNDNAALDFLHYWGNTGYKINNYVSAGVHYEVLDNTRDTYIGGDTGTAYEWIGAYVQFSLAKGFFARFTAGVDEEDSSSGDFYKLSVGMSF